MLISRPVHSIKNEPSPKAKKFSGACYEVFLHGDGIGIWFVSFCGQRETKEPEEKS